MVMQSMLIWMVLEPVPADGPSEKFSSMGWTLWREDLERLRTFENV